MSRDEDKAKRWRPWQFSLRFVMTLIFGVALFFGGWKAGNWHRDRELKNAAAEDIQRLIEDGYTGPFEVGVEVTVEPAEVIRRTRASQQHTAEPVPDSATKVGTK